MQSSYTVDIIRLPWLYACTWRLESAEGTRILYAQELQAIENIFIALLNRLRRGFNRKNLLAENHCYPSITYNWASSKCLREYYRNIYSYTCKRELENILRYTNGSNEHRFVKNGSSWRFMNYKRESEGARWWYLAFQAVCSLRKLHFHRLALMEKYLRLLHNQNLFSALENRDYLIELINQQLAIMHLKIKSKNRRSEY